jgi:hypothetical protein
VACNIFWAGKNFIYLKLWMEKRKGSCFWLYFILFVDSHESFTICTYYFFSPSYELLLMLIVFFVFPHLNKQNCWRKRSSLKYNSRRRDTRVHACTFISYFVVCISFIVCICVHLVVVCRYFVTFCIVTYLHYMSSCVPCTFPTFLHLNKQSGWR